MLSASRTEIVDEHASGYNDDLLAIGKNEKVYRVTITGDNLTYRNLHEKKGEFTTLAMFNDDLLAIGKNGKIYRVTINRDDITYRNLHEKKGAFTTILAY